LMLLKFCMRGFDGIPGNRRTDRLPAERERHPDDGAAQGLLGSGCIK